MEILQIIPSSTLKQLYKLAFGLAIFTIVYNIGEGVVSTYYGYEDESLTLFGFGAHSFIEVISGLGIAHMVWRIQGKPDSNRDDFERDSTSHHRLCLLRFGARTFYDKISIMYGQDTNRLLRLVSLFLPFQSSVCALIHYKTKVGKELSSEGILADAQCTKVCIYMSVILLVASVV